jgi:hypothetical protein
LSQFRHQCSKTIFLLFELGLRFANLALDIGLQRIALVGNSLSTRASAQVRRYRFAAWKLRFAPTMM